MSSFIRLLLKSALVILIASPGCRTPEPALVGESTQGHWVPTRQLVRPAGKTLDFAGRPVDMVAHPTGEWIFIKDHRGIVVLDREMKAVRQQLSFSGGGGSMHGIAINTEGTRLWATDAQTTLHEASISADGTVSWTRKISVAGPGGSGASHST
ncbi:MAG TPA: phosphoesterase, partial [Planctomycetes bacterium]|nr:phosphoesterase [Planctomycetota bacterium]